MAAPTAESLTIIPTQRGEAFAKSLPTLRSHNRRLFLLRHGQTHWNQQGLIQGGGFDIPLNHNGKDQASRVFSELSAIPLGVIASSPLQRALQTANALHASSTPIPRLVDARLGEMRFGDFEGSVIHGPNAKPLHKAQFKAMQQAMRNDIHLCWPGKSGESTWQVATRGQAAIGTLLEQYADNDHLAVVAHGRFNKIMLATLLWNDPSRYVEIEQGNTCINVLDFNHETGSWSPVLMNYSDHAPNANAKMELNNQQRHQVVEQEEEVAVIQHLKKAQWNVKS